jgi:hypothetical protein
MVHAQQRRLADEYSDDRSPPDISDVSDVVGVDGRLIFKRTYPSRGRESEETDDD